MPKQYVERTLRGVSEDELRLGFAFCATGHGMIWCPDKNLMLITLCVAKRVREHSFG